MAIIGMTEARVEELVGIYLLQHAAEKSDEEIRQATGLTFARFKEIKREALREDVDRLRTQSTEEVYLDHREKQHGIIERLLTMAKELAGTTQASSAVAAIKAVGDINERLIKTGQEMGIIEKAPERKQVAHGHAVLFGNMSDPDLRKVITGFAAQARVLEAEYGSMDISEVDFGRTHYDDPKLLAGGGKHNRSSTARVAPGRPQVAKEKAIG